MSMPRALSLAVVAVLVAVGMIVTTAPGGTDARLDARAALPAATITAGTATLAVSTLSLSTAPLYPGLTIAAAVTVTNTGDVPLMLSASAIAPSTATSLSSQLVVGAATVPTASSCTSTTAPVWSRALTNPATGPLNATLAARASTPLCVLVSLPTSAPQASQSQSAPDVQLVVSGVQSAQGGWTATTSAAASVTSGTLSVSQTGLAGLTFEYGATTLSRTATVTVTNGSIPAGYALALAADSSSALAKALTLRTWPRVAAVNGCADAPSSATTSTWAAGTTISGDLGSNAIVVLCVRTTLSAEQYNTLTARSLSVQTSLSARAGDNWTTPVATTSPVQTLGAAADTTPPKQPTGMASTAQTDAAVTLTWTKDSDAAGYVVYRNGVAVATTTGAATVTDTGLNVGTPYSYTVQAVDAAGNLSDLSDARTFRTRSDTSSEAWYQVRNQGLCVTGGTISGTSLTMTECGTAATQLWQYDVKKADFTVASQAARNLDWRRDSGQVQVADGKGSSAGWSARGTDSGAYTFSPGKNEDSCLTAGSPLSMSTCEPGLASQNFSLNRVD